MLVLVQTVSTNIVRMIDRLFWVALTVAPLLLASPATSQQVELPFGTGNLSVPAGWAVLGSQELGAETRESDPSDGVSSQQLLGLIEDLRANKRADQHVVLHRSSGSEDRLQMINCYSSDNSPTSAELTDEAAADKMCSALAKAIGGPDLLIDCTGHEVCDLFAIKGLRMHFAIKDSDSKWRMDVLAIPSGDRLQYFESQYLADDGQALGDIEAVLKSYDGAREPGSRVSNLLIVGLAGAVCGTLTAVLRRRRYTKKQGLLTPTESEAAPS